MIIKYNNKVVSHNSKWVNYTHVDPYNPLNLPPYTLRLKFSDGVTPSFYKGTGVQVSSSPNIWDLTYENSNWERLLEAQSNILEVLGGNTTGVTKMSRMFYNCTSLTSIPLFDTSNVMYMSNMFYNCTSLTSIPLFDTSNVTTMGYMFTHCESLTSIPLFDTSNVTTMGSMFGYCTSLINVPQFNTSNVTDMSYMFYGCTNVQSGALTLYQQASTQTNPPTSHQYTFYNCGSNTTTGAAELAQIPSDWK